MDIFRYSDVDYLKIDAQGSDLAVIKPAGDRIKDVKKIKIEAAITPIQPYLGAPTKAQIVAYLEQAGFALDSAEVQSRGQEENLTFVRICP